MEDVIKKPRLILFDVYETLIDMNEMEKRVNHLMNSKRGYQIWFELFMQYCFVDNCIDQCRDVGGRGGDYAGERDGVGHAERAAGSRDRGFVPVGRR